MFSKTKFEKFLVRRKTSFGVLILKKVARYMTN